MIQSAYIQNMDFSFQGNGLATCCSYLSTVSSLLPQGDGIQNEVNNCNRLLYEGLQQIDVATIAHGNIESNSDILYNGKQLDNFSGLPLFTQT